MNTPFTTQQIIETLEAGRNCIQRAIALRNGHSSPRTTSPESPAVSAHVKRRHLSAAARKRISDAQKNRWAALNRSSL
jgi:hypothetical protein